MERSEAMPGIRRAAQRVRTEVPVDICDPVPCKTNSSKHFSMLSDKNSPCVAISRIAAVETIFTTHTIAYRPFWISC